MLDQSQEKSQQAICEALKNIEGILQAQGKVASFDKEILARKLHCNHHSKQLEEGYVQTDDGTQWEFKKDDAISIDGGCLVIQTHGHDGRGNAGSHAEILISLSKITAVVIA